MQSIIIKFKKLALRECRRGHDKVPQIVYIGRFLGGTPLKKQKMA